MYAKMLYQVMIDSKRLSILSMIDVELVELSYRLDMHNIGHKIGELSTKV
jgi:hypothetical protein